MLFRSDKPARPERVDGAELLRRSVREHLPQADAQMLEIVVAIAGLLAGIAYADRDYSAAEETRVREALGSIEGLDSAGVSAICEVLRKHVIEIASVNPQAYTRLLRDETALEMRREVLDLLVDLAAVDGELQLSETDSLRRTTAALGLTPDDYVISQARHRDKLKLLK